MAAFGRICSLLVPILLLEAISEITAAVSISEPVAARVRTATMGRAAWIFFPSSTRSQASPS